MTTANLCGDIRLAGAPFPAAPTNFASLGLRSRDGVDYAVIGSIAPGAYSIRVVRGEYAAVYGWAAGTEIPKNKQTLLREVSASD